MGQRGGRASRSSNPVNGVLVCHVYSAKVKQKLHLTFLYKEFMFIYDSKVACVYVHNNYIT